MAEPAYTLPLTDPRAAGLELVGGKAQALSLLVATGLPVPDGFVVTTLGYEQMIQRLASANGGERVLSELIGAQPVPAEVAAAISVGYASLGTDGAEWVAVRSSCTAEDLAGASFAGGHETVLGVRGDEQILEAVRTCWASLYSQRVATYRRERLAAAEPPRMAVLVQRMIEPRSAGVLFTADPVTGDPDVVVIECCWGLGESVVSGAITPDRFVIDRRTGETLEARIAAKSTEIVFGPYGTITRPVPVGRVHLPSVGAEHRRRLVTLAEQAELYFGAPQDIEWAIDRWGECHLLQSRPITTQINVRSAVR